MGVSEGRSKEVEEVSLARSLPDIEAAAVAKELDPLLEMLIIHLAGRFGFEIGILFQFVFGDEMTFIRDFQVCTWLPI